MRHWPPGHEKASTSPAEFVLHNGVRIVSRYQKQDEIVLMTAFVAWLDEPICRAIEEIFCDSKACWCFSIAMKKQRHSDRLARQSVATLANEFMRKHNGGHNGIDVGDIVVDPEWENDL